MAIDEPRLKPLVEAVERVVQSKEIKDEFVRSTESKESVAKDAIREIASNVSEFDNWYFETDDTFPNERKERLSIEPTDHSGDELFEIVQEVVEYNIEGMRETDELTIEPDQTLLINQLVDYIINWENWYYEHKVEQDKLNWYENSSINSEIYVESDYGDDEDSQGLSNAYDEENKPYPEKPDKEVRISLV